MNKLPLLLIVAFVAVGMPQWLRAEAQRQERECRRNLETIGAALEVYAVDHVSRYPREAPRQLVPRYLEVFPTCPAGTAYQVLHVNRDLYTVVCGGWHNTAYSSVSGHL